MLMNLIRALFAELSFNATLTKQIQKLKQQPIGITGTEIMPIKTRRMMNDARELHRLRTLHLFAGAMAWRELLGRIHE